MDLVLDLDALERHGWLAIPGLLDPDQAAALAERCASILGEVRDRRQGDKRAGGTHRAGDLIDRIPEIGAVMTSPVLRGAVAKLLSAEIPLSEVAFRCPQPGFGEQTLHTDDLPLAHAAECRAVTAVVALCDFTTENGATAVVPGSHRRPDLQRRCQRQRVGGDEVVLTGAAGTTFVFSAHLLHRGTRNRSRGPRPALQAQWRRTPPALWSRTMPA